MMYTYTRIYCVQLLTQVVWSDPADNGGAPIASFRIENDTTASFPNGAITGFYKEISAAALSASPPYYYNMVFSSASSAVPRFVRVQASNGFARGLYGYPTPLSAQPAQRAPGLPQRPTLIATSSVGLLVQWQPPSALLASYGGDGGAAVQGYLVEWDSSHRFDSPARRALVSASTLRYEIGGRNLMTGEELTELEPGTTYYVRVSAQNSVGYGSAAATVPDSATTADRTPAVPTAVSAAPATATAVTVGFGVPPQDGGESLSSYRVQWDWSPEFEHVNSTSSSGGWADVPVQREVTAFAVTAGLVQEEQEIVASVAVVNEVQTVSTTTLLSSSSHC
jgi:Fibronectin type III domain